MLPAMLASAWGPTCRPGWGSAPCVTTSTASSGRSTAPCLRAGPTRSPEPPKAQGRSPQPKVKEKPKPEEKQKLAEPEKPKPPEPEKPKVEPKVQLEEKAAQLERSRHLSAASRASLRRVTP